MDQLEQWDSLVWLTSDELALRLHRIAPHTNWVIRRLRWEFRRGSTSLLELTVLGHDDGFKLRDKAASRVKAPPWKGPQELEEPSPFVSCGGGDGDEHGDGDEQPPPGPVSGADEDVRDAGYESDEEGFDEDGTNLVDMNQGVVDAVDMMSEAVMSIGIEEDVAEDEFVIDCAEEDVVGAEDSVLVDEPLVHADEIGIASDEVAASSTIEQLVEASTISGYGTVLCALPVENSPADLGRWSSYPRDKPMHARSISMTCKMHGPKCSATRRRNKITDDQLLTWLFSGPPHEPDANRARKVELSLLHVAKFKEMYPP